MKEINYLRRIADKTLELRLEAFGAVQIAGPKWCGKTTTAEQHAASVIKMQDPDPPCRLSRYGTNKAIAITQRCNPTINRRMASSPYIMGCSATHG